jgi:hypothetical protein
MGIKEYFHSMHVSSCRKAAKSRDPSDWRTFMYYKLRDKTGLGNRQASALAGFHRSLEDLSDSEFNDLCSAASHDYLISNDRYLIGKIRKEIIRRSGRD